jgi:hypothetical protein
MLAATESLVVLNAIALAGLIVIQSVGFVIGLVKMHRDSMQAHQQTREMLERMEKYRLVERK